MKTTFGGGGKEIMNLGALRKWDPQVEVRPEPFFLFADSE
jgi:hypothetical protein